MMNMLIIPKMIDKNKKMCCMTLLNTKNEIVCYYNYCIDTTPSSLESSYHISLLIGLNIARKKCMFDIIVYLDNINTVRQIKGQQTIEHLFDYNCAIKSVKLLEQFKLRVIKHDTYDEEEDNN